MATYAAKFLCGLLQSDVGPVERGRYTTAINVRNSSIDPHTESMAKKAILLYPTSDPAVPPETPVAPDPDLSVKIPVQSAIEIDCPDIRNVLLGANPNANAPFIKGWVVIESTGPLDVVAVYTVRGLDAAGTPAGAVSLAIERVPAS